jgi:ribosome-associated protein
LRRLDDPVPPDGEGLGPEGPSKSDRKREHKALQLLARRLLELPAGKVAGLNLDEELAEAVRVGRGIKASSARQRQIRHVANLFDDDLTARLSALLDGDGAAHAREVARFHALERWRDRLLAEGDAALTDFLDEHPGAGADAAALRNAMRQARKDIGTPRAAASARRLFQLLKQAVG